MGIIDWAETLRDEVIALPNTMAEFRKGVEQLSKVTQRLVTATEGIEVAEQHLEASGALDAARVINETVMGVERQVAAVQQSATKLPGGQVMEGVVADLQRNVSDLARWASTPASEPPK